MSKNEFVFWCPLQRMIQKTIAKRPENDYYNKKETAFDRGFSQCVRNLSFAGLPPKEELS